MSDKLLYTWQYSEGGAYVIIYYAYGDGIKFEIWDPEAKSKVGEVLVFSFGHPVREIRFCSVNDVVYIVHTSFRPKKIQRRDDTSSVTGYSFSITDFDIRIDPVLEEYFDRNVFDVSPGVYSNGRVVQVNERPLTEWQVRKGAELLFTSEGKWRGRGRQMLMLKHKSKMIRTWGLLYPSGAGASSAGATPVPKPDSVIANAAGGEGWSSGWFFVHGKITVETAGKWSGKLVVELWTPAMQTNETGDVDEPEELAVLESINAQHNRSISRDLGGAGSRIRIRCVSRERAKSVVVTTQTVPESDPPRQEIVYKDADNDTGCYITLSAAVESPVYLRINHVVPPRNGKPGYARCESLHPFEGGFTSSSFAEGAWSTERYGCPQTVGVFQERMVFGGNKLKPCTLWLSKTGDWGDFVQGSESTSPVFATANIDRFDGIVWMQVAKSYVMFGSQGGEWYFGGGDGGAVKPSNYTFQKLSNFGAMPGVTPLLFGNATVVAKNGGREVLDVSYNALTERGTGVNLSLYASHFFESEGITSMCCVSVPRLLLFVLSSDKSLLSFTYEGDNNVYAWARHSFLDGVEAISSFRQGERDKVAMLVRDGTDLMLSLFDPFSGDDYLRFRAGTDRERVFLDERADGTFARYESRVIPTPVSAPDGEVYGRKLSFSAFDIYLHTHNGDFGGAVWADGTEFRVRLGGQAKDTFCDKGWLRTNVKSCFGENRVVLPLSSGWVDEALVEIRTDYPAPLTITAVGASLRTG